MVEYLLKNEMLIYANCRFEIRTIQFNSINRS